MNSSDIEPQRTAQRNKPLQSETATERDAQTELPATNGVVDARILTLEATTVGLVSRLDRLEAGMATGQFGYSPVYPTQPGVFAVDPRIAFAASIDISIAPTHTLPVNKESAVYFSVNSISGGTRTAVNNATVECVFGGAPAAAMADAPTGTQPRTVVGAGGVLKVNTNVFGFATVWITDTVPETFKLTGMVAGIASKPSATTTITTT